MSSKSREEAMSKGNGSVARIIRRQIGSEANTRFLRSLPAFKLDRKVPARFQELLSRLEEAEDGNRKPERSLT